MSQGVCPWWFGYFLTCPLRRLAFDPAKFLAPYVQDGMTVLEPGPGMGFFTQELARLVGPRGRVLAVDIQPRMLQALRPGASLLLAEPSGHVKAPAFQAELDAAAQAGFEVTGRPRIRGNQAAVLKKIAATR